MNYSTLVVYDHKGWWLRNDLSGYWSYLLYQIVFFLQKQHYMWKYAFCVIIQLELFHLRKTKNSFGNKFNWLKLRMAQDISRQLSLFQFPCEFS